MENTQQTLTIDALEALPVTIKYVAEVPRNWGEKTSRNADQWRVTISSKAGSHSFDYFTGLGLRAKGRPKTPKIADVLHSLIFDASAADENFDDWCDNFGYSSDSIKALNTYKACIDTARALRKHFSFDTLRQISDLLADY